jgi:hypothetical protein
VFPVFKRRILHASVWSYVLYKKSQSPVKYDSVFSSSSVLITPVRKTIKKINYLVLIEYLVFKVSQIPCWYKLFQGLTPASTSFITVKAEQNNAKPVDGLETQATSSSQIQYE